MHGTVGEELRAARLRLGEDLRTVSTVLRIRQEHLEAIEEGAMDRLPGRAYAIGFVRAYAEYLGLDAPGLVARFKQEAGVMPEPSLQPLDFDDEHEDARRPQGVLIFVLLLFLACVAAAVYFAQSADQMLGQRNHAQPDSTPSPAPASAATPAPEGAATPETASSPLAAEPAAPAPPASGGQSYGATAAPSRVTVTALRSGVWLRIEDQASGEVLITRKLQAGDRFVVPDRPNLVLVTRDGGSLELTLDGTPVGRAGGPGTIIDGLSLSPDALAGRLPPPPAAAAPPIPGAPATLPTTASPAPLTPGTVTPGTGTPGTAPVKKKRPPADMAAPDPAPANPAPANPTPAAPGQAAD